MAAIDWRQTDTFSLISSLRRYATLMETQVESLYQDERKALRELFGDCPTEDEIGEFRTHEQHLEDKFELNLKVTLRYSFVVSMQIIFETRLRAFCDDVWKEKRLEVKIKDFIEGRGPIERAKIYLAKHVQIDFGQMPVWCRLMNLQKVRDCIVHTNGFVVNSRDCNDLENLVGKNGGISLDEADHLLLSEDYCRQSIDDIEVFFRHVFVHVGWKV